MPEKAGSAGTMCAPRKVGPALCQSRGRGTEGATSVDAGSPYIFPGDERGLMARYYRVGPAIWQQPWDDATRLAAVYVLTSPHRTTEGLFRFRLEYGAADMGWPVRKFSKAFDELIVAGFVEYDRSAQVCLIVNALKWQRTQNPNQRRGAINAIRNLPPTVLLTRFERLAQQFDQPLAELLIEELGDLFRNTPNSLLLAPTSTEEVGTNVGGVPLNRFLDERSFKGDHTVARATNPGEAA